MTHGLSNTQRKQDVTPVNRASAHQSSRFRFSRRSTAFRKMAGSVFGKVPKKSALPRLMANANRVIQKKITKTIGGISVSAQDNGAYPQWDMENYTWHIHWGALDKNSKMYHCVTRESNPKVHYFFTYDSGELVSRSSGQRGQKKFDDLPKKVRDYVTANIDALLRIAD